MLSYHLPPAQLHHLRRASAMHHRLKRHQTHSSCADLSPKPRRFEYSLQYLAAYVKCALIHNHRAHVQLFEAHRWGKRLFYRVRQVYIYTSAYLHAWLVVGLIPCADLLLLLPNHDSCGAPERSIWRCHVEATEGTPSWIHLVEFVSRRVRKARQRSPSLESCALNAVAHRHLLFYRLWKNRRWKHR